MRQADAARDRIITNGVAATRATQELYVQTMLLERQLRFYAVFMGLNAAGVLSNTA